MHTSRWIAGTELATGLAAAVGGTLLFVAPDGHLLAAKLSVLRGSPFDDWRWPGLLLAVLVGAGFLTAAACELTRWPHAPALSAVAGGGLFAFELAELAWLGFQPLELVFGAVGLALLVSALKQTG